MNIWPFAFIAATILAFASAAVAIVKRHTPKSLFFTFMTIAIVFYVFGCLLEVSAPDFDAAWAGLTVEYIGLPFIPVFGTLFIMDCYDIRTANWQKGLLLLPALMTTILVATWRWNGIFYLGVEYVPGPPLAQLQVQGSMVYYLFYGYQLACLFVMLGISLYHLIKKRSGDRKMEILNAIISLSVFAAISYKMEWTPYHIEVNALLLALASALMAFSIFKLNVLHILPLAQETILKNMKDAFIVVDQEERFMDANPAAVQLFPELERIKFGDPMIGIDGFPPQGMLCEQDQFFIQREDNERYYRASCSDVIERGKKRCTCIMLYDVTETQQTMAELHQMATYDNLTEIYNRGTFMQMAGLEFEKARIGTNSLVIMMFDLDHFKEVNDQFGHICGDTILREVAQLLKSRFRQSDIFGRYGGEEFCACLSSIDLDRAVTLAEELRSVVKNTPVVCRGLEIHVTVSIGITQYQREKHQSLQMVILDADAALYQAKNAGRNSVVTRR